MRTVPFGRQVIVAEQAETGSKVSGKSDMDVLHEIGSSIAAADPLHDVLARVVAFVSSVVPCDSCFVYVLDEDTLVLRASKTPHPDVVDRLKLRVGEASPAGWPSIASRLPWAAMPSRIRGSRRSTSFLRTATRRSSR